MTPSTGAYVLTVHAHQCSAVGEKLEALTVPGLAAAIPQQQITEGVDPGSGWVVGVLDAHATALANSGELGKSVEVHRWLLARQSESGSLRPNERRGPGCLRADP